jgi:predicted kinase
MKIFFEEKDHKLKDTKMISIYMTVGIPASGKSTWAKDELKKDPEGTVRVNRDDLRNMLSNYHFSEENERMVTSVRNFAIQQAVRRGKHVIIDETNLNRRNFDDICKLVKQMNIEAKIIEKPFYIELDDAIARDAARTGSAHVGEDVVRKFWKKSGGGQHKHYKPRIEIITRQTEASVASTRPEVDSSKPFAVVCDLDGTLSLFNSRRSDGSVDVRHPEAHTRSPYDASKSDEDTINEPVAAVIEAMYKEGHPILFCSGREDCYRPQTERFIKKHLSVPYQLFMRKSGDQRKDSIIKSEIYDEHIGPNYNVFLVLDDRDQVVEFWRSKGLSCFQVAPGNF